MRHPIKVPAHARYLGPLLLLCLLGWPQGVAARNVTVKPSSSHKVLTMVTDETTGFQVHPGKPLKLKVVGPGNLTVVVRLNQKTKRQVLTGELVVSLEDRPLKQLALKLHKSRVGTYRETATLTPSLPEAVKLPVPRGLQVFTFALKANKAASMTLSFNYDSEADQSPAESEDELALVPLVSTGETGKNPAAAAAEDDLPLVPLVATAEEKPAKPQPAAPAAKKPEPRKPLAEVLALARPKKEPPPPPPVERKPLEIPPPKIAPEDPAGRRAAKQETQPPAEKAVTARVEPIETGPSVPVFSLGCRAGEISPFQKVGGTTFTAALDLRYLFPVQDGALSLGAEIGYYRYRIDIQNLARQNTTTVLPISLQLFYRLPVAIFLQPYLGIGGDVFLFWADSQSTTRDYTYTSGSGVVFGGHAVVGFEIEAGPGFFMLEARAGISFGDTLIWENQPSISGLSVTAGYRFVF